MARVKLNGYVVSDLAGPLYAKWGYPVIYPASVRQAIDDNPEGEDLVLELNSCGGSVFSGFEIYSILRSAKCHTVAEVQSLAGSAASTIACGCDTVLMSPVAQLMIHDPAIGTAGNIRAHKESLQALNAIKEGILNGYVMRCKDKCSRDRLRDLMSRETFVPAQQAVDMGLADGILYADSTDPALVLNSVQEGLSNLFAGCSGLPSYEELKARNERENGAQSAEEAEGAEINAPVKNDSWALQAALDIEKTRFI